MTDIDEGRTQPVADIRQKIEPGTTDQQQDNSRHQEATGFFVGDVEEANKQAKDGQNQSGRRSIGSIREETQDYCQRDSKQEC